jgi:SAM-dependent methyltransferase
MGIDLMGPDKKVRLNAQTKKAWEDNWENVSMEEVLEIFSYIRVKKQMDVFLKYLPKGQNIFEGGCGIGPYVVQLRRLGYNVIGGDYNFSPLAKVKKYDASMPLVCADVLNTPFLDSSFAAYLSLGVLEHFAEGPGEAICEARRILKRDGVFIVQLPINNMLKMLRLPIDMIKRNPCIRRIFGKPEKTYYWEQYFKPKKFSGMLKENGFDVKAVMPIDHTHNLCTFCGALFRDKNTYDEANALGKRVGEVLEKVLPWSTAAEAIFICRKV